MINPKFLVICAAVGFMASFIAGVAGGVFFGVIVLRSLLFALFSAAAGFGLRLLASKFLYVVDDTITSEPQPQQKQSGLAVDITLDDGELESDSASLVFDFKPAALENIARRETAPEGSDVKNIGNQPTAAFSSGYAQVEIPVIEIDGEDVVTTDSPQIAKPVTADLAEKSVLGGMELLPDIENVSAGFEKPHSASTAESDAEVVSASSRDFDGRPDSSEMVKAIRTILAKDN